MSWSTRRRTPARGNGGSSLKLTEELFAGQGARDRERTLFVVGDEKQSIYSFQGADLANFRRGQERADRPCAGAGRPIRAELLDRSFRSVPAVLAAGRRRVRAAGGAGWRGRSRAGLHHATERANQPGLVELWPLAVPAEREPADEPWPLPDTPRPSDEPERRVARDIAGTIRAGSSRRAFWQARGSRSGQATS